MSNLRRALGDTTLNPCYLATIAGRGYMFVAKVEVVIADGAYLDFPVGAQDTTAPPLQHLIGRELEIAEILVDDCTS